MKKIVLLFYLSFVCSALLLSQNMPSARTEHSIVEIDGDIYLFGGKDISKTNTKALYLNDLHKFDDGLNNWTPVYPSNAPTARGKHAAVVHNKKMLVFFGEDDQSCKNDVWKYDPLTNNWQEIILSGDPISARSEHAVVVVGDQVFIAGGRNNNEYFYDAYRIDPNTGVVQQLAAPNQYSFGGPAGKTGVNVQGNPVFLGGWDQSNPCLNVVTYVTNGDYWNYRFGSPVAGFMGGAVVDLLDQWIYLLGGRANSKTSMLSTLYKYDNSSMTLELISDQLPAGEYANVFVHKIDSSNLPIIDTVFYFWGGSNNHTFYKYILDYNSLYVYNPNNQNWGETSIISNLLNDKPISIFPNPAKDFVVINNAEDFESYKIVDITGKIVISDLLSDKTINLSQICDGEYLLILYNNSTKVSRKIVIEK